MSRTNKTGKVPRIDWEKEHLEIISHGLKWQVDNMEISSTWMRMNSAIGFVNKALEELNKI